jgi:hypothetical protein
MAEELNVSEPEMAETLRLADKRGLRVASVRYQDYNADGQTGDPITLWYLIGKHAVLRAGVPAGKEFATVDELTSYMKEHTNTE